MKVLLVNPPDCGRSIPEERFGIDSLRPIFRGEPLALETVAGGLPGHDVSIVDLKADPGALPEALSRLRPDVAGFTAVTCEANTVLALAARAKEACGAVTVVGGIHASCDPSFFNRPGVDYVAVGLGKGSFAELLAALESGNGDEVPPGVAKCDPGRPLSLVPRRYGPADLAFALPPRYDLVERYRDRYTLSSLGIRLGMVASAFGCTHDCSFCCIAPVTGGRYLVHPVETVLDHVRRLGDIPVVRLVDANTFGNVRHAEALADAVVASGIRKSFVADARADTVVRHPDLFRKWKEAGLRSVVMGLEEIDDGRLSSMDKGCGVAANDEALAILHDLGVTVVGDFIVSPDYDDGRFDALAEYVETRKVDLPILTVLTPLPGTRLYSSMADRIVIRDLDYYTLTNAVVPTRLPERRFYERYAGLVKAFHARAKI
jgi:radical SAM superfamily enzyme YgiQ (UPF0313 family)